MFFPQISMMLVNFGSRDNLEDDVTMCQHHGRNTNTCKDHRSQIIQKLPGFLTVKLKNII
jgi:hypothetical protein